MRVFGENQSEKNVMTASNNKSIYIYIYLYISIYIFVCHMHTYV